MSGLNYITGDIEINGGITLTVTGTLFMRPTAKIVVHKSAQLIVDGGVLTTECSDLWKGVIVMGDWTLPQFSSPSWAPNPQGTAIFRNSALVEHAEIGVSSWDRVNDFSAGGRIFVLNSKFRNNYRGVSIATYPSPSSLILDAYQSSITNSDFIDDGSILPPPSFGMEVVHVLVSGVRGINILGSRFESQNYSGYAVAGPLAILGLDASIVIAPACTNSFVVPCPALDLVYPTFTNFHRAILLWSSPGLNSVVDEAIFRNNLDDINIWNINNARTTRNTIKRRPQLFFNGILNFVGIFIETSDGFWIEGNDIQAEYAGSGANVGIYNYLVGGEENQIYRNKLSGFNAISGLGGGTKSLGQHRKNPPEISGLQYICNEYKDNNTHMFIDSFLIGNFLNDGIRINQGEFFGGLPHISAGNTFENQYSYFADIYNLSNIFFYLHNGGITVPNIIMPSGSVIAAQAPLGRTCRSTFGDLDPEDPKGDGLDGLRLSGSMIDSLFLVYNSSIAQYESKRDQLFDQMDGGSTSNLIARIMNSVSDELVNETLEYISSLTPFVSRDAFIALGCNAYFNQDQIFDLLLQNLDATKDESLLKFYKDQAIYPLSESQINQIQATWNHATERTYLVEEIGNYNVSASEAIKLLIIHHKLDEGLTESMQILEELYASWPGLRYKYTLIEYLYVNRKYDEAEFWLNEIPMRYTLDNLQSDAYDTYRIFYDWRKSIHQQEKSWTNLSEEELSELTSIASRPLSHGSQKASGILCLYYNSCEKPIPYQENTSYTYISKPVDFSSTTAFTIENANVDMFPNPVINEFTIQISEDMDKARPEEFELTIFNLEGKVVREIKNVASGTSINIANLPAGTYVGVLIRNNQVFQSLKFNKL